MMHQLRDSIKYLIKEIAEIAYYMNGGIQYEDLFYRTPGERQIMSDIIVDILKAKSGSLS